MKNAKVWIVLAALVIFPKIAFARIDAATGNFSDTWVDLDTSSNLHLSLTRTYNSRSQTKGLFGYGWCSSLETKLEKLPGGDLRVIECGAGQWADFKTSGGHNWVLAGAAGRQIESVGGLFQENLLDGSKRIFDSQGRLKKIVSGPTGATDFNYNEAGQLASVRTAKDSLQLNFKFNPSGFVESIEGTGFKPLKYRYDGDNLVRVTNAWQNTYSYEYDQTHNLVAIRYPDHTSDLMSYDEKRDLITGFKSRFGCSENLIYPDDAKDKYSVKVNRICGSKKEDLAFTYRVKSAAKDRIQILEENISSDKNSVTRIYSESSGQLISAQGSAMPEQKWTYYDQGRLKVYSSGLNSMEFGPAVNQCPQYIISRQLFQTGKPLSVNRLNYTCDAKGLVTKVSDEKGVLMNAGYDTFGRLIAVKERDSGLLNLVYTHGQRRPASVIENGAGKIDIKYDQGGEPKELTSELDSKREFQVREHLSQAFQLLNPVQLWRAEP